MNSADLRWPALQAAHKRGILLRTLRLSHVLISSDGRRLKLGPSALANFALTDGTREDGGGRLLSANDFPPLRGPVTDAMTPPTPEAANAAAAGRAGRAGRAAGGAPAADDLFTRAPPARPAPGAPSGGHATGGWGSRAMEGLVGPPLEESLLAPELLARSVVPEEGLSAHDGAARGAWKDEEGSEVLGAACDVW